MKKLISLALVLILALSSLNFMACGGEKKEEATPSSETPAPQEETAPASPTWADIPIYSGASQTGKVTTRRLGAEFGEFEKMESWNYETKDAVKTVASFYKAKMPKEGWQNVMTTEERKELFGSIWQKKDGDIMAVVTVLEAEDGGTNIIIARYEGKK